MSDRRQVNMHISAAEYAQLKAMADAVGKSPGGLARELLLAVLEDDAKAHDQPSKEARAAR